MVKKSIRYFENDPFSSFCKIKIVEAKDGYATAQVTIEDCHLNKIGMVHGGLIFTLADYCFGVAANLQGKAAPTVQSNILFLNKATEGVLTATARRINKTRKLDTYQVEIHDDNHTLIASFSGIAYLTGVDIPNGEHQNRQNRQRF